MSKRTVASAPSLSLIGTQLLQILLILGFLTLVITRLTQASMFSQDFVADPTRPYSPTTVSRGADATHVAQWLNSSAWTWVGLGLLIALVVITLWRYVLLSLHSERVTGAIIAPIVMGVLICLVGLAIACVLTSNSSENTFSTWAKQRYGIELESYPKTSSKGLSLSRGGIDTSAVITLDDGQTVRMKTITDARGVEAYLIAPAKGSSDELNIIATTTDR